MHAHKNIKKKNNKKTRAHTYQDTTEIQISDVRIQWCKPGLLISSPAGLHHTFRR